MNQYQLLAYLNQKNDLLGEMKANTETQLRFIARQDIRGLRRLIQERQQLIDAFATLCLQVRQYGDWNSNREIQPLLLTIEERQRDVMELSQRVKQLLENERDTIRDRLRQVRQRRVAHNYYAVAKAAVRGSYLNTQG